MKTSKIRTLLMVFAAAVSIQASEAFGFHDFKDATGTLVHLSDNPSRIVTLAPSVAELAAEFLGMDLQRIVGVSESTDYPPGLKNVESIGPYQRFNLERVVALKPDLVLATFEGNSKDQVLHLRELGLPVFVLNTGSFEEVEIAMAQTAEILGQAESGARVVTQFKKSLAEIRARGRGHAKQAKRIMLQLDEDPLIVAGGRSFLTDELEAVGAVNVFGDAHSGYPRPSAEEVLKRNPDAILVMAFGPDVGHFKHMAARWTQYPEMAATRKKQITVIYAETLLRPSMRLLEGLAVLERALYGKS